MLLLSNLAYFTFIPILLLACKLFILVSYSILLILILFLPYFQPVSYLFLLLLFNLAHFIFILASYLACELISTLILFI